MQTKICEYCEKYFKTHMTLKRFCSEECRDKGNLNRRRYGGNHFKVLKRDGFKCTECNGNDRLCVHHKDENIRHNDMSNLITLCIYCHTRHHSKGDGNLHFKHITKSDIVHAIETTDTLDEAAEILGITRKTLMSKRLEYGLGKLTSSRKGSSNKLYIHLTPNEINMAFELEGSWVKAAERLGISESFLRKRRRELGMEENKNRFLKEISKEDIINAIEQTSTMQEAADFLGITRKTLMKKRDDYNLPKYDRYRNKLN